MTAQLQGIIDNEKLDFAAKCHAMLHLTTAAPKGYPTEWVHTPAYMQITHYTTIMENIALGGRPPWAIRDTVQYGDEELTRILIAEGADVNERAGELEWLPLHFAQSVPCIKVLLAEGADVNAVNKEGVSALHNYNYYSADCVEQVELLLRRGAWVNPRNKQGKTPLGVTDAALEHSGGTNDASGYSSPLEPACVARLLAIKKVLIAHGGKV